MKSKTKSVDEVKATRLITAIKTPYLPDGKVDLAMYDALVEKQIAAGIGGLIVGGTTGEGQLMSWDEHIMLIAHTAKLYGDNLCIVGNTGSNSTREAVHATSQGFAVGAASLPAQPPALFFLPDAPREVNAQKKYLPPAPASRSLSPIGALFVRSFRSQGWMPRFRSIRTTGKRAAPASSRTSTRCFLMGLRLCTMSPRARRRTSPLSSCSNWRRTRISRA
jgi:hypothetical protein